MSLAIRLSKDQLLILLFANLTNSKIAGTYKLT